MSFQFSDFASQIKAGQSVAARDTLGLRQWAWSDGVISQSEAEGLFDLNNVGRSPAREWVDFFVEAVTEYVVNQQSPRGYVDDDKAAWLMARIDHDGHVDSLAELELLVKVLESAMNVPGSLKSYALAQIERIVLTGSGPTRQGGDITPGRIDDAEVALLRRLIFARGGDGALKVSEDEADLLFRIKDATLTADNAVGWAQLFVQGVGNFLMAHGGDKALSLDETRRLDGFLTHKSDGVLGFAARIGRGLDWQGARDAVFDNDDLDEIAAREAAIAKDREISGVEQAWLDARISADGARDVLEEALLAFIETEKA